MKKIFYSFAILSLVFTSCNPMEDIYEEVDAQQTIISGEAKFTLTDGDYDTLGLDYGNFSSTDDAKDMLPEFLSDKRYLNPISVLISPQPDKKESTASLDVFSGNLVIKLITPPMASEP